MEEVVQTLTTEGKARVEAVLRKAAEDIRFREQLLTDPAAALEGMELTAEEREMLSSMRRTALEEWGVDIRRFRTFLMDNGNGIDNRID
jgi:hypothetical protein